MRGLSGGDCYSWTQAFNPQQPCATAVPQGSETCSDATWFWVIAAGVALVAVFKK
jgi:hypothetical protein